MKLISALRNITKIDSHWKAPLASTLCKLWNIQYRHFTHPCEYYDVPDVARATYSCFSLRESSVQFFIKCLDRLVLGRPIVTASPALLQLYVLHNAEGGRISDADRLRLHGFRAPEGNDEKEITARVIHVQRIAPLAIFLDRHSTSKTQIFSRAANAILWAFHASCRLYNVHLDLHIVAYLLQVFQTFAAKVSHNRNSIRRVRKTSNCIRPELSPHILVADPSNRGNLTRYSVVGEGLGKDVRHANSAFTIGVKPYLTVSRLPVGLKMIDSVTVDSQDVQHKDAHNRVTLFVSIATKVTGGRRSGFTDPPRHST